MKKRIIFFLLFFAFKLSVAQNIFVSGDKNNFLFIGVDNPLTIAVENIKSNDIVVKVDKGQLTRGYGQTYIYRGSEPGNIIISIYTKADLKEIGQINFRVKYIPDPILFLEKSKNSTISQSVLKTLQFASTEVKDFDYNVYFSIDSFTVTIVHIDNCSSREFVNIGGEFRDDLKKELLLIKKNDFIIFKNIYVKGPDAISKLIAPAIYTLSE